MKTSFLVLLILFSHLLTAQYSIVPQPKQTELNARSYFELNGNYSISYKTDIYLNREIKKQLTNFFTPTDNTSGIEIAVNHLVMDNVDSYELIIAESTLQINYSSSAALLFALSTLEQLKIQDSVTGKIKLPTGRVFDYPDYEWRGLHLDCARHFFEVDEIKRFIDLMAHYKFNIFHWHLTDDQGWRIEIKKYPKLTQVGAKRNRTLAGHYNDEPRQWDSTSYTGFYTQSDIKDVVNYAKNKGVTVVPEIELPGHARAALAAYPKLSCTDSIMSVPCLWGVFDEVFCSDKRTITFLKNVLDEVCTLFPSEYIHIGGDEAPIKNWESCKKCQRNIKKNNLNDEHALQGYFIGQISDHLAKKGKKMIGWDEILEAGLSENDAVMSWRGIEGGIKAAHQNHKVVMSPTEYCYFDYYQSANRKEPLAIGGYLPLQKVYEFNPTPTGLAPSKQQYIMGGQANLWTEYISSYRQLEYMTYPRALALIEKLWNKEAQDYTTFLQKLPFQFDWLTAKQVNYSKALYDVTFELSSSKMGELDVKLVSHDDEDLAYSFLNQGVVKDTVVSSCFTLWSESHLDDLVPMSTAIPLPRINPSYQVQAFSLKGRGRASLLELEISQNIGLQPISYTPPHPKFTNQGYLTLVDGVFGQRPWKGNDWLGYLGDTIELVYDLQEVRYLKDFKVSCLKANGSWIYLPSTIDYQYSIDNLDWSENKIHTVKSERSPIRINKHVRFVKIKINPMDKIPRGTNGAGFDPWTFIDEIQFSWM